MQLTPTVEETIREVIDAVMNARTYAERFKKECNMTVSVETIAFDLAIVPGATGATVDLADPGHLPAAAAANRIRFDIRVDMHGFDSRR